MSLKEILGWNSNPDPKNQLKPPDYLILLLEENKWPRNSAESQQQYRNSRFSLEAIKRIAPEESSLYLIPPPFSRIRPDERDQLGTRDQANPPGDIDPERSLIIADFGVGSETSLALDYRIPNGEPTVIRSVWNDETKSVNWRFVANTFMEFAKLISL